MTRPTVIDRRGQLAQLCKILPCHSCNLPMKEKSKTTFKLCTTIEWGIAIPSKIKDVVFSDPTIYICSDLVLLGLFNILI